MANRLLPHYYKDLEGKFYTMYQLQQSIKKIVMDNMANYIEEVKVIARYLHYCTNAKKFYINSLKRQIISMKDYIQLLLQIREDDADSDDSSNSFEEEAQTDILNVGDKYKYVKAVKHCTDEYSPFGSQWIHDVQKDDEDINIIMVEKYNALRSIVLPEQRSEEWFKMRNDKITASDGGTAIGMNKYEPQYNFILKKTVGSDFKSNKFCYHGKKYEHIDTMIYQYRMNVRVEEFGLLSHPTIDFLGASPDGICTPLKYDGIHKSKFVGRMVEIKCPLTRKIIKTGELIDNICPLYYWIQVQLQLECCDLEECDFWQCVVTEYTGQDDFIQDTDMKEPFRSKETGLEKGCLIQLLPKNLQYNKMDHNDTVYEQASFIYPPRIEMSPYDCERWISETLSNLETTHPEHSLDRVIFWRLDDSFNITINRDRQWFASALPTYTQVWNYVLFFRKNKDKLDLLLQYINSLNIKKNKAIMNIVDRLYHTEAEDYDSFTKSLSQLAAKVPRKKKQVQDDYMFVD